mmetsp:Transcript_165169/g.524772  ORF Transcript_165169/g.524772 Transcript_165169/m.524772 type:complete len:347 (+) Transcript_165169:45-1085(+)
MHIADRCIPRSIPASQFSAKHSCPASSRELSPAMAPSHSGSTRRRGERRLVRGFLALSAASAAVVGLIQPLVASVPAPGAAEAAVAARRQVLFAWASALALGPAAAANAANQKFVVLGGSGFVGSRICERLVASGASVTSISRSGGPPSGAGAWAQTVNWVKGDVLTADLSGPLQGAEAVISAIGAIGSDDDERLNGATAEVATSAAAKAKVARFVLVSATPLVAESGAGAAFPGYVKGKQRAEAAVKAFPGSFAVLQPTFIYGGEEFSATPPRVAAWYGDKIEALLGSPIVRPIASISPAALKLALLPPNSVEDVAAAAVAGAFGKVSGMLSNHDEINAAASQVA